MNKHFSENKFTSTVSNVQVIYNSFVNSLLENLSRNTEHNSSYKHQQHLLNLENFGGMFIKEQCLGGEKLISNKGN